MDIVTYTRIALSLFSIAADLTAKILSYQISDEGIQRNQDDKSTGIRPCSDPRAGIGQMKDT